MCSFNFCRIFFKLAFPFKLLFFNKLHHSLSLTAYGASNGLVFVDLCLNVVGFPEVANMLQPLVMVDSREKQINPWCQQDMRKTSRHLLTASRCATLLSTLGVFFWERRATRLFFGGVVGRSEDETKINMTFSEKIPQTTGQPPGMNLSVASLATFSKRSTIYLLFCGVYSSYTLHQLLSCGVSRNNNTFRRVTSVPSKHCDQKKSWRCESLKKSSWSLHVSGSIWSLWNVYDVMSFSGSLGGSPSSLEV